MNYRRIIVEDVLGQRFSLASCTLLCPKMGELDYGDPHAVVFPDGITPMLIDDLILLTPEGDAVNTWDIEWEED